MRRAKVLSPSGQKGVSAKVWRERVRKQYGYWRQKTNPFMPSNRQYGNYANKSTSFMYEQIKRMKEIFKASTSGKASNLFKRYNYSAVKTLKGNLIKAITNVSQDYYDTMLPPNMETLFWKFRNMSNEDFVEFYDYVKNVAHAEWVVSPSEFYFNVVNAKMTNNDPMEANDNYASSILGIYNQFLKWRKDNREKGE